VGLEVQAKVQQWLGEWAALMKEQGDEEAAAQAPVAVEERMDGLELDVGHGRPQKPTDDFYAAP